MRGSDAQMLTAVLSPYTQPTSVPLGLIHITDEGVEHGVLMARALLNFLSPVKGGFAQIAQ